MGIIRRTIDYFKRGSKLTDNSALAEIFGLSRTTASGVNVTPENARNCPEVDACVGLIEDTVATIPLDLFERADDGTRVRRDDHPLHALLHDAPNDWQTSAEFRLMMEGWRSTYGNAYARVIWRGDGCPEALEPVHPHEMRPYRLANGKHAYQWMPSMGTGGTLMPHEVLHLKDKPFTRDLLRGQSRVERHRECIGLAMATTEYLSRFFSNNAVPKTFIEVPAGETLTEEQKHLLVEQFEKRHGGLSNAHKVGILNAGIKLNKIGVDNEEAKVIESYSLAVSQIARTWGIPLHLIGEMSKSTSWGTGIEQQSIGFIVYFMRPKFVMWEQALNATLMSAETRKRLYFEFNADGLLRGDFKSRMDGYAILIQWGLATPNEIRRKENLPPLPGGDERLHPLNMAPASRIMDVLLKNQNNMDADHATRLLASLVQTLNGEKHA